MSGSFHSAQPLQGSPTQQPVSVPHSFFWLSHIPLAGKATFCLLFHLLRTLGLFTFEPSWIVLLWTDSCSISQVRGRGLVTPLALGTERWAETTVNFVAGQADSCLSTFQRHIPLTLGSTVRSWFYRPICTWAQRHQTAALFATAKGWKQPGCSSKETTTFTRADVQARSARHIKWEKTRCTVHGMPTICVSNREICTQTHTREGREGQGGRQPVNLMKDTQDTGNSDFPSESWIGESRGLSWRVCFHYLPFYTV